MPDSNPLNIPSKEITDIFYEKARGIVAGDDADDDERNRISEARKKESDIHQQLIDLIQNAKNREETVNQVLRFHRDLQKLLDAQIVEILVTRVIAQKKLPDLEHLAADLSDTTDDTKRSDARLLYKAIETILTTKKKKKDYEDPIQHMMRLDVRDDLRKITNESAHWRQATQIMVALDNAEPNRRLDYRYEMLEKELPGQLDAIAKEVGDIDKSKSLSKHVKKHAKNLGAHIKALDSAYETIEAAEDKGLIGTEALYAQIEQALPPLQMAMRKLKETMPQLSAQKDRLAVNRLSGQIARLQQWEERHKERLKNQSADNDLAR